MSDHVFLTSYVDDATERSRVQRFQRNTRFIVAFVAVGLTAATAAAVALSVL